MDVQATKTNDEDEGTIHVYPTVEEILNSVPVLDCVSCGKKFKNVSACRLHRVKVHKIVDEALKTEMRLHQRLDGDTLYQVFHCPVEKCELEKKNFSAFSHIKQHYIRAHTEKKFACDKCGFKSALEKDVKYHKRIRCIKVKEAKRKLQQQENGSKRFCLPSTSVTSPVIIVVSSDNVQQVVENLQYSMENSTDNSTRPTIKVVHSETSTQDIMNGQMTFVDVAENGYGFDHSEQQQQQHQSGNSCERGTEMASTSMQYYDQQYGNGFSTGDGGNQKPIDYSGYNEQMMQQSSQTSAQTRSFGTTMTSFDRPIGYEYVGSQADGATQSNPETRNFGTTMDYDRSQEYQFVVEQNELPPQTRNFGTTMSFDRPQNPGFEPMETRNFGTTMANDGPQGFGLFEQKMENQNQTRNFGTTTTAVFDSVSTRHAGTSMSEEDFVSLYLRDTETQTPNFLEQPTSSNSEGNRGEWPWRME